jgi:hypothetical protein
LSSILGKALLPAAVAIAMLSFISALGTGSVRTAHAVEGDVCQVYTNAPSVADFDGQGNTTYLVNRGEAYGIVFRIEDDEELSLIAGLEDNQQVLMLVGEVTEEETGEAAEEETEEATEEETEEAAEEETEEAIEEETEEATEEETEEAAEEETEEAAEEETEEATEEETEEAAEEETEEAAEEETEEAAEEETEEAAEEEPAALASESEAELEEVELLQVGRLEQDLTGENVEVRVDSETGSARITSMGEILDLEEQERDLPDSEGEVSEVSLLVPNIGHTLINPGVGSKVLDTISPRFFNDPDGNALDDIGEWLLDVGYPDFVGEDGDDPNVCGKESGDGTLEECPAETDCTFTRYFDDSWGFFDFECIEAGYFHIDIRAPDDTEETGRTLKFFCGGQAETAAISASPETVETHPVGESKSSSIVTVSVEDQFDDRIDGVEVIFMTDNCRFSNPEADDPDDFGISPAGGGTTVTVLTDTDSTLDDNFLADNPLEHAAGTAEVSLDCATGTPGTAHVTAIVERPGSDLVLKQDIKVVGPTSVSGLGLTLTPVSLQCGETIQAKATAVDATGTPVSDGTPILFTTDTSSGVVGGTEGAQGAVSTVGGMATALIATDPGNPGIHTVIAYVMGPAGVPSVQVSEQYECEGAVAPVAPTVKPPPTGTGSIVPPSTGDAGLATRRSGATPFVLAALAAFMLTGLGSLRFALA